MSKEYTRSVNVLGQIPVAGQLVFYDDFEKNLHWIKSGTGGDDIFELDPTLSKHGNQSLYMATRTADAALDDFIVASRRFYLLPSKVMSIFSNFRFPDHSLMKIFTTNFLWHDGITTHTAYLRFTPNTPKWEYLNSTGGLTEIPSLALKLSNNAWHLFHLKVNFSTGHYLSLQVDHQVIDLSDIPLSISGTSDDTSMLLQHEIGTIGASPTDINIDDVLVHEL